MLSLAVIVEKSDALDLDSTCTRLHGCSNNKSILRFEKDLVTRKFEAAARMHSRHASLIRRESNKFSSVFCSRVRYLWCVISVNSYKPRQWWIIITFLFPNLVRHVRNFSVSLPLTPSHSTTLPGFCHPNSHHRHVHIHNYVRWREGDGGSGCGSNQIKTA